MKHFHLYLLGTWCIWNLDREIIGKSYKSWCFSASSMDLQDRYIITEYALITFNSDTFLWIIRIEQLYEIILFSISATSLQSNTALTIDWYEKIKFFQLNYFYFILLYWIIESFILIYVDLKQYNICCYRITFKITFWEK